MWYDCKMDQKLFLPNASQFIALSYLSLDHKCPNSGPQVDVATKCYAVEPNIYGSSVWNSLCFALLTDTILRWLRETNASLIVHYMCLKRNTDWYHTIKRILFWGAFSKLRKATISFIMTVCLSVRPSVRPRGTTRLPPDGFSLNLIFEYFPKTYRENSSYIEILQE